VLVRLWLRLVKVSLNRGSGKNELLFFTGGRTYKESPSKQDGHYKWDCTSTDEVSTQQMSKALPVIEFAMHENDKPFLTLLGDKSTVIKNGSAEILSEGDVIRQYMRSKTSVSWMSREAWKLVVVPRYLQLFYTVDWVENVAMATTTSGGTLPSTSTSTGGATTNIIPSTSTSGATTKTIGVARNTKGIAHVSMSPEVSGEDDVVVVKPEENGVKLMITKSIAKSKPKLFVGIDGDTAELLRKRPPTRNTYTRVIPLIVDAPHQEVSRDKLILSTARNTKYTFSFGQKEKFPIVPQIGRTERCPLLVPENFELSRDSEKYLSEFKIGSYTEKIQQDVDENMSLVDFMSALTISVLDKYGRRVFVRGEPENKDGMFVYGMVPDLQWAADPNRSADPVVYIKSYNHWEKNTIALYSMKPLPIGSCHLASTGSRSPLSHQPVTRPMKLTPMPRSKRTQRGKPYTLVQPL